MKARLLNTVATVLVLALVVAALPLTIPKLFGYKIYAVLTASMAPALPVGSAIYVKECDPQALQPGSIVTFTLNSATNLVQTHRVMANDPDARQLTTQGDANAQPDIDPVDYSRVVGQVALALPAFGSISQLLASGKGVAVCVTIFAVALGLWALADKLKKRENTR